MANTITNHPPLFGPGIDSNPRKAPDGIIAKKTENLQLLKLKDTFNNVNSQAVIDSYLLTY